MTATAQVTSLPSGPLPSTAPPGASAGPTRSVAPIQTAGQTPTAADATYVVVQPGDTLSGIAQRYGLTLDVVLAANPQIADRNLIRPGDRIAIPGWLFTGDVVALVDGLGEASPETGFSQPGAWGHDVSDEQNIGPLFTLERPTRITEIGGFVYGQTPLQVGVYPAVRSGDDLVPDRSTVLAAFALPAPAPKTAGYVWVAPNLVLPAGSYYALFAPQAGGTGSLLGGAGDPFEYRAEPLTVWLGSGSRPTTQYTAVRILGRPSTRPTPTLTPTPTAAPSGMHGEQATPSMAPAIYLPLSAYGTATIDGVLSPAEWAGAARIDFAASVPPADSGVTTPASLFVMNDATNLFLALTVVGSFDTVGLSVEVDNDDDGVPMEDGDDAFVVNLHAGVSGRIPLYDDFRYRCPGETQPGRCGPVDTTAEAGYPPPGTDDGSAAGSRGGDSMVLEVSKPLASGDMAHDFQVGAGDAVGIAPEIYLLARCGSEACSAETLLTTGGLPSLRVVVAKVP